VIPIPEEKKDSDAPKKQKKMDITKIIQLSRKGLDYKQIAVELGTTYQVVRNTVYRANRVGAMSGSMNSDTVPRKKVKKLSKEEVNKLATRMEKYMTQAGQMLKEENRGRATAVNVHVGMCVALGAQVDLDNINSLYAAFESYLKLCAENDCPLTMTSACLACGIKPSTLSQWRKGNTRTEEYKEFAESVTYAVQAGIESMMAAGIINPVVGIWWEKAHFNMREADKVEATENDPLGQKKSAEEIAAEYEGLEGGLPD
jgi:transposase-like protein